MDRHALWRKARSDWEECKRRAPTGYEPVVEVYLAGLSEPMTLGFVRTSREPDYPWIHFESEDRARAQELKDAQQGLAWRSGGILIPMESRAGVQTSSP